MSYSLDATVAGPHPMYSQRSAVNAQKVVKEGHAGHRQEQPRRPCFPAWCGPRASKDVLCYDGKPRTSALPTAIVAIGGGDSRVL